MLLFSLCLLQIYLLTKATVDIQLNFDHISPRSEKSEMFSHFFGHPVIVNSWPGPDIFSLENLKTAE